MQPPRLSLVVLSQNLSVPSTPMVKDFISCFDYELVCCFLSDIFPFPTVDLVHMYNMEVWGKAQVFGSSVVIYCDLYLYRKNFVQLGEGRRGFL